MTRNLLVTVEFIGYAYTLTPVNERWRRRIIKHLAYWGEDSNGSILVQDNTYEFWETLSKRNQKLLDLGWSVDIKMDTWEFLQGYVGYDAGDRPQW
jgi:hypothetical protein